MNKVPFAALLLTVASIARAAPTPTPGPDLGYGILDGYGHEHYHHPNPYEFGYGVVDPYSGNDFGHSESSDGAGSVQGRYFVLLPDGRRQVVNYIADHHGYQAQVSYEGVAHFPLHEEGHYFK